MLTINEVQKIARRSTGFPYSFQIENGELHISFYDMEIIAANAGSKVARQIAVSGEMTDKGFLFTK